MVKTFFVFCKVDIIINYINLSKIIDGKKEGFTKGGQTGS